MTKIIRLQDILDVIQEYKIIGSTDNISIQNAKKIDEADENSIVWLKPGKSNHIDIINKTAAKAIICSINDAIPNSSKTFICVENPKLVFSRIVKFFFLNRKEIGVHSSAIIHKDAVIANDAYIGPFSYIGKSVIGSGSVIYGNCYIYDNVTIGNNVTIHAGTVIGSDGFGYTRNELNEFEQFPHIGGVIIEDNVEIGSNTSIDRGTLGNTIIKKGAKIDNQVH
ncbi:MAG: hypothetical protein GYA62_00575, partial [Bacteroidales bacterium]|nr:hypothetical protein [Bacteroidales bacterium]